MSLVDIPDVAGRLRRRRVSLSLSPCSQSLGRGAGTAHAPDVNRLTEAVFLELCRVHDKGQRVMRLTVRWEDVLWDYSRIRDNLRNSRQRLSPAHIQLLPVNRRTLLRW